MPIVDEHTLEARLLKGLTRLDYDQQLVLDDQVVGRGSQFPTLWTDQPGGRAKYLDAMVRRDATPIAIELKVATGGQGRYYRRSLVQAVLYRYFITNAPGLDPWFQAAGLDQTALEAAIGIPPRPGGRTGSTGTSTFCEALPPAWASTSTCSTTEQPLSTPPTSTPNPSATSTSR